MRFGRPQSAAAPYQRTARQSRSRRSGPAPWPWAAALLLVAFAVPARSQPPVNDVKGALARVDREAPCVRRFLLPDTFLPRGGHFQGAQIVSSDRGLRLWITGSSDSLGYVLDSPFPPRTDRPPRLVELDRHPFDHAGGLQAAAGAAAVGVEDNDRKNASRVYLVTADGAAAPRSSLLIERRGAYKRATAGATALLNTGAGRLLAVASWDAATIDFYERAPGTPTDAPPFAQWSLSGADRSDWSDAAYGAYQNINLVRDSSSNVFLAGFGFSQGAHRLDLFLVRPRADEARLLKKEASFAFQCKKASFQAGAGLWIKDADEIHVVACASRAGLVEHFQPRPTEALSP